MRKQIALLIFSIFSVAGTGLYAQVDHIVDLLQSGQTDSALAAIERMDNPNAADTQQFLKALAQKDGVLAIKEFETLISRFPDYQYNGHALLRLGQAHYAQAGYRTALQRFKELEHHCHAKPAGTRQQNAGLLEKAHLWIGRSYQALGMPDSAAHHFDWLRQNSTTEANQQKARSALNNMGAETETSPANSQSDETSIRWTVQVGAFSNQIRAISYKDFFEDRGYKAKLGSKDRQGSTLFLVWIGSFRTRNEAQKLAAELKSKWAAETSLVQTEQ